MQIHIDRSPFKSVWVLLTFLILGSINMLAQSVELKNDYYYINGKKTFLKCIGYEVGASPGELPWAREFKPEIMHSDIQRIIAGGYNTIRTWDAFTEQELELLSQYDINIIMGIWIDPAGDFSNRIFGSQSRAKLSSVIEYSKNYSNIISYLIMNEPKPEHIFSVGYEETEEFLEKAIEVIHTGHPGIPVSIANTSNGTYIKAETFDFSAYNAYVYNPVTVHTLHRYQDFIKYLKELGNSRKPLILTEYGLSVSPSGIGNWGYGGNSLQEQEDGVIHMYQSLVNGGATGSCVFNYSDGWWKAGNEFFHDDSPEEWFGLVEYTSVNDHIGQERQIWSGVSNYQSVIITEPKNSEIYSNIVPIEMFSHPSIERIEVVVNDSTLRDFNINEEHITDSLTFDFVGIQDISLEFKVYGANDSLVKNEIRTILISNDQVILPSIDIEILSDNVWSVNSASVMYSFDFGNTFSSTRFIDFASYPHYGFDYGSTFSLLLDPQTEYTSQTNFSSNVDVLTVGAAFDITYNSFKKRIVNQRTLTRDPYLVTANEPNSEVIKKDFSLSLFPNPTQQNFSILHTGKAKAITYDFIIYNILGAVVQEGTSANFNQPINVNRLASGMYLIRINTIGELKPVTLKFLKF